MSTLNVPRVPLCKGLLKKGNKLKSFFYLSQMYCRILQKDLIFNDFLISVASHFLKHQCPLWALDLHRVNIVHNSFHDDCHLLPGLMVHIPDKAILAETGKSVPVEDVVIGTMITVCAGEKIPLDGNVTKGQASVDESSITGESIPIEKSQGDKTYSGTIVQNGYLEVREICMFFMRNLLDYSTVSQTWQLEVGNRPSPPQCPPLGG